MFVYTTNTGWLPLHPGEKTPDGVDADAVAYDPTSTEGPTDANGNPKVFKIANGDSVRVTDVTESGTGETPGIHYGFGPEDLPNDGYGEVYPEQVNGINPKNLPPGHNGTPDDDLANDPDYTRDEYRTNDDGSPKFGDDFWDDINKDNPNDPNYQPPTTDEDESASLFPAVDEEEEPIFGATMV